MIQNSFIFLERVQNGIEQNLWQQGIRTWDHFLQRRFIKGLSLPRKAHYNRKLIEARKALYNQQSDYFSKVLPSTEHYRLYDYFKNDAVFLDIETTGLSPGRNQVTMVGLYDGINTKIMIQDINLEYKSLKEELQKYKLLITFNGASFDVPFLNKTFPGIIPNIPHFDVKHLARKVGLVGGLKKIEKDLGIARKELIEDFNGGDAVTLWKMYKATGDEHYLNLLIEYNEDDIINLKKIAEHCITLRKLQLNLNNNI